MEKAIFAAATFTGAAPLRAHAARSLLVGMLGGKVWPNIHFLPLTMQEVTQEGWVWSRNEGSGGQRKLQRKSSWKTVFLLVFFFQKKKSDITLPRVFFSR